MMPAVPVRHGPNSLGTRMGPGRDRRRTLASSLLRSVGSFPSRMEGRDLEARDERRLLRSQKQLAKQDLLIVDELGYVPLSKTGAELLFEIFSQRYEQGSTLLTSNLPFTEWTEVLGSERMTGALLDRLTHHVHKSNCHPMGRPASSSPSISSPVPVASLFSRSSRRSCPAARRSAN